MNIMHESDTSEVRTFDPGKELAILRSTVRDMLSIIDLYGDALPFVHEFQALTERLRLLVI